jgi:hypothetical protein
MATLLSISDGNMMTGTTWGVVEPTSFQGTPTVAIVNSITTSLITGTVFVLSSVVTLSGVAIQLGGRVASPTGTLNVQLYNVTLSTIVGQVTINVIDLPNSNGITSQHIDWTYFKFPSPITTVAGNSYAIRLQASVTSQVSFYYTTTTTNPNRALITTTSQVPVTGDALIISGQYTSAGVNTTTTVTVGLVGSGTLPGTIWVSSKGILKFSTSVSSYLEVNGNIVIGVGGTFTMGTLSDPVLSTNTSRLIITCLSPLQYSIYVYGTFTTYGESSVFSSKLASDISVGATSSTTTTPTGWKTGMGILIPSTTRIYTQYEFKSLSADASGTTLFHNATTYAHGGNSLTKVQADILNLSLNKISIESSLINRSNIRIFANSVVTIRNTRILDMGTEFCSGSNNIRILFYVCC